GPDPRRHERVLCSSATMLTTCIARFAQLKKVTSAIFAEAKHAIKYSAAHPTISVSGATPQDLCSLYEHTWVMHRYVEWCLENSHNLMRWSSCRLLSLCVACL